MPQNTEFSLLLLLTHPQQEKQQNKIKRFLTENKINWIELTKSIKWHRVTPQAYDSLKDHSKQVPQEVLSQLKEACTRCKTKALRQTAWLLKIAKKFREHQIRFIAMKGVTLSQLLYSSITMRESCDVDIIIDLADIERAEEILTDSLGFLRVMPVKTATKKQIQYLNTRRKDRIYYHKTDKTILELHWRFNIIEQYFNIPFSVIFKDSKCIDLNKKNVNVLSEEYLWLYQSVHGSTSSWYRLHWINDVAKMLVVMQPNWNALLLASERYQCKKSLVEAVMLATELYELSVPEKIMRVFQNNQKLQSQLKWSKKTVQAGCVNSIVSTFRRQLFFSPTKFFLSYFMENLRITPTDFQLFPLPDKLFFLYYWLRPVFRLIRVFRLDRKSRLSE